MADIIFEARKRLEKETSEAVAKEADEQLEAARQEKDRKAEAAWLVVGSDADVGLGDYEAALDKASEAATFFKEVNDQSGLAVAQLAVAMINEDIDTAVQAADEAADIFKAAGQTENQVEMLLTTAKLQLQKEATSEAMRAAKTALDICKAKGHKQKQEEALGVIIDVNLMMDKDTDANDAANNALAIAKESGNKFGEAAALNTLGQLAMQKGDLKAASEYAQQMLEVCKASDNTSGQAAALHTIATTLLARDEYSEEGFDAAQESVALYRAVGDTVGGASALHTFANCLFMRGEFKSGLQIAREALDCFRITGDVTQAEALKSTIDDARAEFNASRQLAPAPRQKKTELARALAGPGKTVCNTPATMADDEIQEASERSKAWGVPKHVEPDAITAAAGTLPKQMVLWGKCLGDFSGNEVCADFSEFITVMAKRDVKIPIIVLTSSVYARSTGQMAPGSLPAVSGITMWGLIRTTRQEIPAVVTALVDINGTKSYQQYPRMLKATSMESAYYHGGKFEPQIEQVPSLIRAGLKRDHGSGSGKGKPQFMRKSFNWMGPNHKLDFCWYRQSWKLTGPAQYIRPEEGSVYPYNPVSLGD